MNNREAFELLQCFITYARNEHRAKFAWEITGHYPKILSCDERDRIIDDFLCGSPITDINKREAYIANSAREPLEKRLAKLEPQNAEMLAMLKTLQVWGELYSQDHKIEFVQLAEQIKKVEGK